MLRYLKSQSFAWIAGLAFTLVAGVTFVISAHAQSK